MRNTVWILAAIVALGSAAALSAGTIDRLDEYGVRAAFLVTFTRFIQWPHEGALAFCIAGDDVFTVAMTSAIGHRRTDGREMGVRSLGPKDDFTRCDVVFVGKFATRRTAAILKQVHDLPLLTVSESEAFLDEGGDVRVFVSDNRIRFQINAKAAGERGIKINSQLLSLATR